MAILNKFIKVFVLVLSILFSFSLQLRADDLFWDLYDRSQKLSQEGKYAEALEAADEALKVKKQQIEKNKKEKSPEEDASEEDNDLNIFQQHLANLYVQVGRYPEAEKLYLAIDQRVLQCVIRRLSATGLCGHENKTKCSLGDQDYQSPPFCNRSARLEALFNLANVYDLSGRYEEEESLLGKTQDFISSEYESKDRTQHLLALYQHWGAFYYSKGDFKQSERYYKKALAELDSKTSGMQTRIEHNLALLYKDEGKYKEAEALLGKVLRQYRFQDDLNLAVAYGVLGSLYDAKGQYQKSIGIYEKGLRILEENLGEDHPYVARRLNNFAEVYRDLGEWNQAESMYLRAQQIFSNSFGPQNFNVAIPLNNLAELKRQKGQFSEALSLYEQSLKILKKNLGEGHLLVAESLDNRAQLEREMGQLEKAKEDAQKSLEMRGKILEDSHPQVVQSLWHLGDIYRDQKKYAVAITLYHDAYQRLKYSVGPKHPDMGRLGLTMAGLAEMQNEPQEAEKLYHQSIKTLEKAFPEGHRDILVAMNQLAMLYQSTGKSKKAEDLLRKIEKLKEKWEIKELAVSPPLPKGVGI